MPRLTYSESVALGTTVRPIQNWQYEYLPWPAVVRVLASAAATGVEMAVSSGSEQIQRQSPVSCNGAPAIDDLPSAFDVEPLTFVAPAGDRLDIAVVNTTGGAIVSHLIVDVEPR